MFFILFYPLGAVVDQGSRMLLCETRFANISNHGNQATTLQYSSHLCILFNQPPLQLFNMTPRRFVLVNGTKEAESLSSLSTTTLGELGARTGVVQDADYGHWHRVCRPM